MYYPNLLSPIRIGNHILKNRLIYGNALPHFLQGPETYPAEAMIRHYGDMAKNGAAIVTCSLRLQRGRGIDGQHATMMAVNDLPTQNYINQMTEAIRFYGSKAAFSILQKAPDGFGVVDSDGQDGPPNHWNPPGPKKAMGKDEMNKTIDEIVSLCKLYQSLGFDMINLHMSYGTTIFAHFLSRLKNTRQDEYGGSLENRTRFPLELCRAIKQECGESFLIEAQLSGEEEGGFSVEELVEFSHLAEGLVDIFQIRAKDVDLAHPTGFNSVEGKPVTIGYAEKVKQGGAKVLVAPMGGYQDPAECDAYIAEGKADLIAMARSFICDPDYGEKLLTGRGQEFVPCIRCNRCHGVSRHGKWISVCSVNPKLGLTHRLGNMVSETPIRKKRVAVVGGGPAGMKAALVAAERGHTVTLFEKQDRLGGQLFHADYNEVKWPIRKFRDYLIAELEKSTVEVKLATSPTREVLEGYDVTIAATGARPTMPDIAGIETCGAITAYDVYGHEQTLGKRVVVVGGSETGAETALYLMQQGHTVTILSRQRELAKDAPPVHYRESMVSLWRDQPQFTAITKATTVALAPGQVTYLDKNGESHTLETDSIVIAGGMLPCQEEAMALAGVTQEFYVVGDCSAVGNIQTSQRSAFAIASAL